MAEHEADISEPGISSLTELSGQILPLFRDFGDSEYGGEQVSQRAHALQTAWLAEKSHASPALIMAALLHDIGHLLHHLPDDAPDRGIDDRHEELGASWLAHRLPPAIVEPIRLHVPAKRYLATRDPAYRRLLSEPSLISLALQGGEMSASEIAVFESLPYFQAAVQLRRWDDAAKVVGLTTPDVSHFLRYLEPALREAGRT